MTAAATLSIRIPVKISHPAIGAFEIPLVVTLTREVLEQLLAQMSEP